MGRVVQGPTIWGDAGFTLRQRESWEKTDRGRLEVGDARMQGVDVPTDPASSQLPQHPTPSRAGGPAETLLNEGEPLPPPARSGWKCPPPR